MAKIKEDSISMVKATFFHNKDTGKVYPVCWFVRTREGCRTFESYGKNATDFPYPAEKLPKAVQAFLEKAVAGKPMKAYPKEVIVYQ